MLFAEEKRLTPIEKAFELARSGKCRSVSDVNRRLRSEKFDAVYTDGAALKKQLLHLIQEAKQGGTNPYADIEEPLKPD